MQSTARITSAQSKRDKIKDGSARVEKISANKARQGRRGAHLLAILVVGLLLAAAVWVAVEYFVAR
jgi:hypothetical protein